jgi:hypothetical protein
MKVQRRAHRLKRLKKQQLAAQEAAEAKGGGARGGARKRLLSVDSSAGSPVKGVNARLFGGAFGGGGDGGGGDGQSEEGIIGEAPPPPPPMASAFADNNTKYGGAKQSIAPFKKKTVSGFTFDSTFTFPNPSAPLSQPLIC